MPCFHPLRGFRGRHRTASGKVPVVFSASEGWVDQPVELPCGQCVGCRLERSRQWAVRCVHEASLYEDNCFITLTYDDEHVPEMCSLRVGDFQKFMKRLRKRVGRVRFFHCGEYGEQFGRPHYHACLFGYDFSDRELWSVRQGVRLYTSAILSELWPFGFSSVGDVTFESAAYVARYIMKKVTGEYADEEFGPYWVVDERTGEYGRRDKEYVTMSRGGRKKGAGGIGAGWFEKFGKEVYPDDFVVVRGVKMRPPRFYDGLYEHTADVKRERRKAAVPHRWNNTPERLRVREQVKLAQISSLKREVD